MVEKRMLTSVGIRLERGLLRGILQEGVKICSVLMKYTADGSEECFWWTGRSYLYIAESFERRSRPIHLI